MIKHYAPNIDLTLLGCGFLGKRARGGGGGNDGRRPICVNRAAQALTQLHCVVQVLIT